MTETSAQKKQRLMRTKNNRSGENNRSSEADFGKAFNNHQEPLKRLTIQLTASQHRKLKTIAFQQDRTMTEILSEYIDSLELQ